MTFLDNIKAITIGQIIAYSGHIASVAVILGGLATGLYKSVLKAEAEDFVTVIATDVSKKTTDDRIKLLEDAASQGLLTLSDSAWQVTPLGRRYLNSLLEKLVS